MRNYIVDRRAEKRELYTFTELNSKGEQIGVEFIKCDYDLNRKNSLPRLWKKNGYINKMYDSYWHIDVYATDQKGNCWGKYNPMHKLSDDGGRYVINFDFLFEATEENKQLLLNEVIKRAFN